MNTVHGAGNSKPGKWFTQNEDTFLIDDGIGLYVVCDGASNAAAGQFASRIAAKAVRDFVRDFDDLIENGAVSELFAAQAVEHAFSRVYECAEEDDAFKDMNTTLTMLLVGSETAVVGHVGDSRLYLVRDERLHQLTEDHRLSDSVEGRSIPLKSRRQVEVDRFSIGLCNHDVFLLCSDGLNGVLADEAFVIETTNSRDLRHISRTLIRKNTEDDGVNDATVVAVRVSQGPSAFRLMHFVPRDLDLTGYVSIAA